MRWSHLRAKETADGIMTDHRRIALNRNRNSSRGTNLPATLPVVSSNTRKPARLCALSLVAVDNATMVVMIEFLTLAELRYLFPGLDPRTIVSRNEIQADGIVRAGSRTITVYDAAKVRALAETINKQQKVNNK
jgi:hypothetical protein